jgi:hypothetical protein
VIGADDYLHGAIFIEASPALPPEDGTARR